MTRTILLLAALAATPIACQSPAPTPAPPAPTPAPTSVPPAAAAPTPAAPAPPTAAAPAADGTRLAGAGVYTDSEAVMGESVYRATCSACHTPSDQSGPQFKLNWFGRTIFDYFINLKKTMPDDNPGGLSDDEYRRATAYILKLNGFKPGAVPLPVDTTEMKLIKIDSIPADTIKPPTETSNPARMR